MTKYNSKLQGKKVLVLGGTSGIGFCVAEAALEFGAIVVISSSKQAKIDATIERLLKSTPGGKVTGIPCDLANPATAEANVENLLEFATKDGKIDHIVNTAGDSLHLPKLADVKIEDIHATQQVRLMGSIMIAKHCMSYMNVSNTSSLTFTGGVNTHKPNPGWAVIASAGAGLEGLTRGLAVDLKPIRVNLVAPGAVMTELWQSFGSQETVDQVANAYKSKHLTGEIGTPEDVAEAYLYLMKDRFVDGQVILSEGGLLLM